MATDATVMTIIRILPVEKTKVKTPAMGLSCREKGKAMRRKSRAKPKGNKEVVPTKKSLRIGLHIIEKSFVDNVRSKLFVFGNCGLVAYMYLIAALLCLVRNKTRNDGQTPWKCLVIHIFCVPY